MGHHQHRKSHLPTQALVKFLSLLPNFDKRRARRVCNRWMFGLSKKFDQMRQLLWPMDAENSSALLNDPSSMSQQRHPVDNIEDTTSTAYGNIFSRGRHQRSRFFSPSQFRPPNWKSSKPNAATSYSTSQNNSSYSGVGFRDLSDISRQIAKSRQRSHSACGLRHGSGPGRHCYSPESFPSLISYSRDHSNQSPGQSPQYARSSSSSSIVQNSPSPGASNCDSLTENNYIALPQENQRDRLIRYSPSDQYLQGIPATVVGVAELKQKNGQGPSIFSQDTLFGSLEAEVELSNNPSAAQYGNSPAEIIDTLATGLEHPSPNQYAKVSYSSDAKPLKIPEINAIHKLNSESSQSIQGYFQYSNRHSEDDMKTNYSNRVNINYDGKDPYAKYRSESLLDRGQFPVQNVKLQPQGKPYHLAQQQDNNLNHDYEYRGRGNTRIEEDSYKPHPHRSSLNEGQGPSSSYNSHQTQRISRITEQSSTQRGHKARESSRQHHHQSQHGNVVKKKHHGGVAHQLHFHRREPGFNQADIDKFFDRNTEPPSTDDHDGTGIKHPAQIKYHHMKAKRDDYSKIGHKSKKIVVTKKRKIKKNG